MGKLADFNSSPGSDQVMRPRTSRLSCAVPISKVRCHRRERKMKGVHCCLNQHHSRLRDKVSIDTLPDSTLLVIFSYLDPLSLCKCAQVSQYCNIIDLITPSLLVMQCVHVCLREGSGSQGYNYGELEAMTWSYFS